MRQSKKYNWILRVHNLKTAKVQYIVRMDMDKKLIKVICDSLRIAEPDTVVFAAKIDNKI